MAGGGCIEHKGTGWQWLRQWQSSKCRSKENHWYQWLIFRRTWPLTLGTRLLDYLGDYVDDFPLPQYSSVSRGNNESIFGLLEAIWSVLTAYQWDKLKLYPFFFIDKEICDPTVSEQQTQTHKQTQRWTVCPPSAPWGTRGCSVWQKPAQVIKGLVTEKSGKKIFQWKE